MVVLVLFNEKFKLKNSKKFRKQIHNLIPGGAHISKGDDQFPELSPACIKGKGSFIWMLIKINI